MARGANVYVVEYKTDAGQLGYCIVNDFMEADRMAEHKVKTDCQWATVYAAKEQQTWRCKKTRQGVMDE